MTHSHDNVYRWSFDADNYKSMFSDDVYRLFSEHAHLPTLGKLWGSTKKLTFDGPKRALVPDLAEESMGLPLLSAHSVDALRELLPRSAQLLKTECGGSEYWALNVLWTKGALVMKESRCDFAVDTVTVVEVVEGTFRRAAIEGEVFSIPECLPVYVTGKFLNAVEEHGLKGLITNLEPMGRLV